VFMLAFTGGGGENTDVLAHLTGFVAGLVAGALLALRPQMVGARVQWCCGIATLGVLAGAWAFALSRFH